MFSRSNFEVHSSLTTVTAEQLRNLDNQSSDEASTGFSLSYNGKKYKVSLTGSEISVTRERKASCCCPSIARIIGAIRDFFARWSETRSFSKAFSSRAHALQEGLALFRQRSAGYGEKSDIRFFTNHKFEMGFDYESNNGQAVNDQTTNNESASNQSGHNQWVNDQTTNNESASNHSSHNQRVNDQTANNESASNHSSHIQRVNDQTANNESASNHSSHNQKVNDQRVHDQATNGAQNPANKAPMPTESSTSVDPIIQRIEKLMATIENRLGELGCEKDKIQKAQEDAQKMQQLAAEEAEAQAQRAANYTEKAEFVLTAKDGTQVRLSKPEPK